MIENCADCEAANEKIHQISELVDRYPSDVVCGRIRRIINPELRDPL